jgi:hypothetical protein
MAIDQQLPCHDMLPDLLSWKRSATAHEPRFAHQSAVGLVLTPCALFVWLRSSALFVDLDTAWIFFPLKALFTS